MDSSHIGRLRNGTRPLPKKHDFLAAICLYLAEHFKNEYQIHAVKELTGISSVTLGSVQNTAKYLEHWLLEQKQPRIQSDLISDYPEEAEKGKNPDAKLPTQVKFLYGNAGKRKGTEMFFLKILQESEPQTLLLFSDENMAWMYEDPAFARRWTELFTKVIMKGNRIRIIHTISRDMNEIMEALLKWLPIYMTGMIEPYYYPRLRDGVFQYTMFIAPKTSALISSSVRQHTDGMLNILIHDKTALDAVALEYEQYFSQCRPLMQIYTEADNVGYRRAIIGLTGAQGNVYIHSDTPPMFAAPETLIKELEEEEANRDLMAIWKQSVTDFQNIIRKQKVFLVLLDPDIASRGSTSLRPPLTESMAFGKISYTTEQYLAHVENLKKLEERYENLSVRYCRDWKFNAVLYVKEEVGTVLVNTKEPKSAFIIREEYMVNAFWDYLHNRKKS